MALPVFIDEVQYAPELFSYIKLKVDQDKRQTGQFWLTGSQQFSIMQNISESLASRIAIFSMSGLSLAEEENRPNTPPFVPTPEVLSHRYRIARPIPEIDIYHKI